MDLISIIIPCHNYGWLLAATLDSVLQQTYQNWECIIVDDGSTDNTAEIALIHEKLDSRFRYIHCEKGGVSAARNTGIRAARGEYLQFLDSDDLLVPTKLAMQVAFLQANQLVSIVYGDVRFFQHGKPETLSTSQDFNDRTQQWMTPMQGSGNAVIELLIVNNQSVVQAPLIRVELAAKVGGFNETLVSMEDWDYWLRCAFQGATFAYLDTADTWSLVRIHPGSASRNTGRMLRNELQMRKSLSRVIQGSSDRHARAWQLLNEAGANQSYEKLVIDALINKHWIRGAKDYFQFGTITGAYVRCLRAVIYWARH